MKTEASNGDIEATQWLPPWLPPTNWMQQNTQFWFAQEILTP